MKNCSIAGFTLGLSTLTRPIIILFPIFILFYLLIGLEREEIKRRLMGSLVLLLFFVLPILPWTLRNLQVHHAFVPISTQAGLNFYQSVRPIQGKIFGPIPDDEIIRKSKKLSSEVESSHFLFKEGLKIYRQEKSHRLLKFFILRMLYFWSPFDWEILGGNVYNYHFVFILLFSIIGMYILLERRKELFPLYFTILYFLSSIVIFQGAARYRISIDPYLIIFAVYAIYFLFKKYSNKILPTFIILTWFGINFLLYLNSDFTKESLKKIAQMIGIW
jgi:4-amino-4-deoxy-L-arabinose transferase-like glycosyltransferase